MTILHTINLPEDLNGVLKKVFQSTKEIPETILLDWIVNPVWMPEPDEIDEWAKELPTFSLIQLWTMVYRDLSIKGWSMAIEELKNRGEDVDHQITRWGLVNIANAENIDWIGGNVLWAIVNRSRDKALKEYMVRFSEETQKEDLSPTSKSIKNSISNWHQATILEREIALTELEKRGHDIATYLAKFESNTTPK